MTEECKNHTPLRPIQSNLPEDYIHTRDYRTLDEMIMVNDFQWGHIGNSIWRNFILFFQYGTLIVSNFQTEPSLISCFTFSHDLMQFRLYTLEQYGAVVFFFFYHTRYTYTFIQGTLHRDKLKNSISNQCYYCNFFPSLLTYLFESTVTPNKVQNVDINFSVELHFSIKSFISRVLFNPIYLCHPVILISF